MARPIHPSTPKSRERAEAWLRRATRGVVLGATGVAALIGVVVAQEHPGSSSTRSGSSGGSSGARSTSGSSGSSSGSSTGTGSGSSSSTTGSTGDSGNSGSSGNTGTSTPSISNSQPAVTSGGSSGR